MKNEPEKSENTVLSDRNITILYASQAPIVLETLERDGIYYVKNEYIDRKYGDSAWIFRTAYREFIRQMRTKIQPPPGAESPVWLFPDPRWAEVSAGSVRLKLAVPSEEAVFFDQRDWNRILNLSPIGTEEEVRKLENEFRRQGIASFSDVFANSFYPLMKKKVTDTWKGLLDGGNPDQIYAQAAVWYLKREWIIDIVEIQ